MNKSITACLCAPVALAALTIATPSSAVTLVVSGACSASDLSATVAACGGYYKGNLLSASKIDEQAAALAALGFNWDKNWSVVNLTKVSASESGIFNFADLLNGTSYIGIYKLTGDSSGFEGTGFFKLTSSNVDTFKLNLRRGFSAVLYANNISAAVPEPATWAMTIAGFGLIGSALRRRQTVRIAYGV